MVMPAPRSMPARISPTTPMGIQNPERVSAGAFVRMGMATAEVFSGRTFNAGGASGTSEVSDSTTRQYPLRGIVSIRAKRLQVGGVSQDLTKLVHRRVDVGVVVDVRVGGCHRRCRNSSRVTTSPGFSRSATRT